MLEIFNVTKLPALPTEGTGREGGNLNNRARAVFTHYRLRPTDVIDGRPMASLVYFKNLYCARIQKEGSCSQRRQTSVKTSKY